jgi:hypothetical protein
LPARNEPSRKLPGQPQPWWSSVPRHVSRSRSDSCMRAGLFPPVLSPRHPAHSSGRFRVPLWRILHDTCTSEQGDDAHFFLDSELMRGRCPCGSTISSDGDGPKPKRIWLRRDIMDDRRRDVRMGRPRFSVYQKHAPDAESPCTHDCHAATNLTFFVLNNTSVLNFKPEFFSLHQQLKDHESI